MMCQYKNSLGEPGVGFHRHFLGVAIGDVIGTVLISILFARLFKFDFFLVLLIIFTLGIVLHRIFCVNTTVNKLLFGKV